VYNPLMRSQGRGAAGPRRARGTGAVIEAPPPAARLGPRRPAAFSRLDEAVAALSTFGKTFAFPSCAMSDEELVARSVGNSVFRCLAGTRERPAEIYRRWALENARKISKSLRYVINQDQYDALVRRAAGDFIRSWRGRTESLEAKIAFGPAMRIVSLFMKAINESESHRSEQVLPFMHVPFDSSTLLPLRLILNELLDLDYAIGIPTDATMSFVATEDLYCVLTGAVFELARRAGIPPLAYEYWCAAGRRGEL
jgi:hypothetical protein